MKGLDYNDIPLKLGWHAGTTTGMLRADTFALEVRRQSPRSLAGLPLSHELDEGDR